ncbi:zinc finger and BTB domain-containing protein 47-like [Toxorhynchites rutilus septentrionalis]|uniref:zinc finger and BTB domain-containing protein 47-like n=1 Tax=Toxorhynchites rutilus septentrionalis TaxID=329112 RepID=UPI00247895D1|nr:zinc finger and BTB domain-containing protein 47-like [Toxorhynchites rutilus septentrionalis]
MFCVLKQLEVVSFVSRRDMAQHNVINTLCRLCLKESDSFEEIFGRNDGNSLVLRIMASVSLEVHQNDSLSKIICTECRYQLEKTYIFRNRVRNNDIRYRRHVKLLAAGKSSNLLDDLDEDDDEFEQSLVYIKTIDGANDVARRKEWDDRVSTMELEYEAVRKLERSTIYEEVKQELLTKQQQRLVDACTNTDEMINTRRCEKINPEREPIVITINGNGSEEMSRAEDVEICQPDDPLSLRELTHEHLNADGEPVILKITSIASEHQDTEFLSHYENSIEKQDEEKYLDEEVFMEVDDAEEGSTISVLNEEVHPGSDGDNGDRSGTPAGTDRYFITEVSDPETFVLEHELDREEQDLYGSADESEEDLEAVTNAVKAELAGQPGFNIGGSCIMKVEKDNELTKVEVRGNDGSVICMEFSTEPKKKDDSLAVLRAKMGNKMKCARCPTVFKSNRELREHTETVHPTTSKGHTCDRCEKWCPTKSSLQRHYRIHTGEKPFICAECGKSFVQKEILKRHMLVHLDEKPYSCEHCSKRFNQKDQLRNHINIQHTENPVITIHKCNMCDKQFKYASGLSRHLALHYGRTFACFCGRIFTDKSALKRHEVGIHGKNSKDQDADK